MNQDRHYSAFISYRHNPRDIEVAKHIQQKLEHFKIPAQIAQECGYSKFDPLFRDQEELEITPDLAARINQALDNSDYLIVICSPYYNESKWCLLEIENFLKNHDRDHVLCVLSQGEPPEIFPETLCHYKKTVTDKTGKKKTVTVNSEPLACDYRGSFKDADRIELPRLASAMIGCNYDELVMRQEKYRRKKLTAILASAFAAAAIIISYLLYSNAVITRNYRQSLINESRLLSREALNQLDEADRYSALNSALKALEGDRPQTDDAIYALSKAVNAYQTPYQYTESWMVDVSADIQDFIISKDGKHIIYKDSVSLLHTISMPSHEEKTSFSLGKNVYSFEEGKPGQLLAYVDGTLYCVDYLSGETLWDIGMKYQQIGVSHMSHSGEYVATADSFAVQVTDDEGVPFLSMPMPDEVDAYMRDFCWSTDDKYIAVRLRDFNTEYSIGVFDFDTSEFKQVSEPQFEIISYGFLEDGRLYVLSDNNASVSSNDTDSFNRYEGHYVLSLYDPWDLLVQIEFSQDSIFEKGFVLDGEGAFTLVFGDRIRTYDDQGNLLHDYSLQDDVYEVLYHNGDFLYLALNNGYRGMVWLNDGHASFSRCFPENSESIQATGSVLLSSTSYVLLKDGNLRIYESSYDRHLQTLSAEGFYYAPESFVSSDEYMLLKTEDELLLYPLFGPEKAKRIELEPGHAYHPLEILDHRIYVLKINAKTAGLSVLTYSVENGEMIDEKGLPAEDLYIRNGFLSYPLNMAESMYLASAYEDLSPICLVNHRLYLHDTASSETIVMFDLQTSDISQIKLETGGAKLLVNGEASTIQVSDDEKTLLSFCDQDYGTYAVLFDLETGEMTPLPEPASKKMYAQISDSIAYIGQGCLNVCDRKGNPLYQIGFESFDAVAFSSHNKRLYCVCDDHTLRIYEDGSLVRSVRLSFDSNAYTSTIPFRFKFTKDCLYLYNDDRMEVIHLDSDSSMPLYYIGDSVLEYNEKEDSIFVYAYDPSRKGDDYYLGCYKPYDASSLIEIGQKELEHYK
ncbi:MAG: toll/interleukin-1 receptor domain-containing protein [Erysipelotrichaceae bacterium]|nr:toll/interleukin-1 receptor domain-containing protein [Erysipelotrichaceae bacterium]